MKQGINAVIFDVNHTLIGIKDEERLQISAVDGLYEEIESRCACSFTREEFHAAYNDSWKAGKWASFEEYRETKYESVVERTIGQLGVEFSAAELEEILQIYMEPLYRAAYVMPGMWELLESLAGRVRVGVVTNYKYGKGMLGLLRRTGLSDLIDGVAISSEVGWKKPALAIYEDVLHQLSTDATACVLVGNELEKDLWQGSKMGMKTVLYVTPEHALHDAEFAELLRSRIAVEELKCDFVAHSSVELKIVLDRLIA